MAAKRKTKAREAQLAFESLSIEGGLFSPEWLSKVAQLQADTQADADYRIPKGLNLRDEIGRYWRIAQAHWADFKSGHEAKADPKITAERFVFALLRDAFGFTAIAPVEPVVLQERTYPISHATLSGRVPIVIAPADRGLDTLFQVFGDGARRRSAFGLVQEYLNAQEGALWGVTSDGITLRIIRDNASLTRPAWIEADLQCIFAEQRYADFAALWLLCHETRFGREGQPVIECALETWRNAGREEGTRARDYLRRGVEEALVALGQGFLSQAENAALRVDLQNGTLSVKDYFSQLLRLVYRLIFLLTVEERGLLHPDGVNNATRALYANGYGIRRLRERSVKRSSHDRFADLWETTKIVFRGLAAGEVRLGLPALAGIFAANQCPALDGAKLENHALLLAAFKLAWLRQDGSLSRVNWRDMGPEELGSVYESLLELVPKIAKDGRQFSFATGGETKGNARKTTGSYYTPDSLVQVLLDSALEPVIADTIAKNPGNAVEALLCLSIVDPACGSGHFLLAAARRLAAHVARIQAAGTPSAIEYRHALRQVVGRCIFGVDLNPMAVELCKVGLWMEAIEPGLPLTFLNSHIQHGNALLGTTSELMESGIPDAAWDPIEGDDRKTASALKKRNKAEAGGQRTLDFEGKRNSRLESEVVARAVAELDAESDVNVQGLVKKESRWDGILDSPEYRHQKLVADAWCASFIWPKQPGELSDAAPTNELWRQLRDGQEQLPAATRTTIEELTDQYCFFHWHLQFPQVFAKGGFDLILGNPPWDELSPDQREFFAKYHPDMRSLSREEQDHIISTLLEDRTIAQAWSRHLRCLYATVHLLKKAGRFTLYAPGNLGKGDFNVYRMFVELALKGVRPGGYAAQVAPAGLYGGANASAIRQFLLDCCELKQIFGLINTTRGWFHDVDMDRFCAYSARGRGQTESFATKFGLTCPADLAKLSVEMTAAAIRAQSPTAYAIPDVRNDTDLAISLKMEQHHPQFSVGWPWRHYQREVDMTNESGLFTHDPKGIPVYEGRMVTHFDHRAKTYISGHGNSAVWCERPFGDSKKAIVPQWRILRNSIPIKLGDRVDRYRIGFGGIANPRNERSFMAALIPPGAICGNAVPTIDFGRGNEWMYLPWLAVANSFVIDALTRKKLSSPNLKSYILDTLPFPRPSLEEAWAKRVSPLVLRLTCTSPEMTAYWNEMAAMGLCEAAPEGTVPRSAFLNEESRAIARAEIDAVIARDVYGLSRDELSGVLDTFPVLKKRDEKTFGEYRTKRLILKSYDEFPQVRGATVVPFPAKSAAEPQPAVASALSHSYIPAWSPSLLPVVAAKTGLAASAGCWGTALIGVDLGIAALAAVLRNMGGPSLRDKVERAVVLSVLPSLLWSKFDGQTAPIWRRAIGTANMNLTSIAALSIPWAEVLRRAAVEHLLETDTDGRWRVGADIDDAPSDVLDARALVSLSWLENVSGVIEDDMDLVTQLGVLCAA